MKKIIAFLFMVLISVSEVYSITFDAALEKSSSQPMALLLYADWADNAQQVVQAFSLTEQKYNSKYNFVKMNIADKETKSFNKMCSIMPNLPYVVLFRDGTKFSRIVKADCVTDSSCFSDKLDAFDNR